MNMLEPDLCMWDLSLCRVQRVDSHNGICMAHVPQCNCATPYGNYCEHPGFLFIRDYAPGAVQPTAIDPAT